MMAIGENFKRINHTRNDAIKRKCEETRKEALNMKTTNTHIIALRNELDDYKQRAKSWEEAAKECEADISSILTLANVNTIPELLNIIQEYNNSIAGR